VLSGLNLVPLFEAVYIPFVRTMIGDDGALQANEAMEQAAVAMLDELVRVEAALRPLRTAATT
jgi:hypothetical protein